MRWREVVDALDADEVRATVRAQRILRIAASLGAAVALTLRDLMPTALGSVHASLVLRAVAQATGKECKGGTELAEALDLIASLLGEDHCRLDTDGACYAHGLDSEPGALCPVQAAKNFLGEHGHGV